MSTHAMTEQTESRSPNGARFARSGAGESSPRFKARITGALYLLTILTGIFAQGFVSGSLVVDGDAAATATNILAHRGLFQLGFAVYLIEMACNIAMTALFYDLLKPAGRSLSLIAAFLGLTGCVLKTLSRLFFIAPLSVLGGAHYLSVFSARQLQALALLFLKVNDLGAGIALVFFGFYALLMGYLIVRSTFLPRVLGVLSVLGGLGWLTFLYPPLGYRLFPYIAAFGVLGAVDHQRDERKNRASAKPKGRDETWFRMAQPRSVEKRFWPKMCDRASFCTKIAVVTRGRN